MREKVQAAFDNILDTMGGADGGMKFMKLMMAIRQLDEQAEKGDKAAEQVIRVIIQFSKLIDITTGVKG